MSQIITFYSYKGGVGRSMALANVATLLSKWGKKVLMIDWDLEAPGLENFFREETKGVDWAKQKGVLEWLYAQQNGEEATWHDWVVAFQTSISKIDLHLLPSGKANGNYAEMLRDFDVSKFYAEHEGGRAIEQFREELLAAYDYVLIDSRTGVTDFGGICTIQLPDVLVMLFTPTEQGLAGTSKIARRILDSHTTIPFDRFRLVICPVPSKFDSTTEFQESRKWLERIAAELGWLYEDLLPTDANIIEFLQVLKIPYISYFSFGEKLPVIEQGASDPAGLGYAYESLAMLVADGFDEVEKLMEKREEYLEQVSGQKSDLPKIGSTSSPEENVLLYIVSAGKDRDLKFNVQKSLIKTSPYKKAINFFDIDDIPFDEFIGRRREEVIKEEASKVDIVLFFISKESFTGSSPNLYNEPPSPRQEIQYEMTLLKLVNIPLIIPVYLESEISKHIDIWLSRRIGISLFHYPNETWIKVLQERIETLLPKILAEKKLLNLF